MVKLKVVKLLFIIGYINCKIRDEVADVKYY